jgi:hypothetical protein
MLAIEVYRHPAVRILDVRGIDGGSTLSPLTEPTSRPRELAVLVLDYKQTLYARWLHQMPATTTVNGRDVWAFRPSPSKDL